MYFFAEMTIPVTADYHQNILQNGGRNLNFEKPYQYTIKSWDRIEDSCSSKSPRKHSPSCPDETKKFRNIISIKLKQWIELRKHSFLKIY